MSVSTTSAPVTDAPSAPKKPSAWRQWMRDPNPILVKELRTIFRTKLFIRFLYLSTALLALLVMMVGGVASAEMSPADVGQVVYQLFFGTALMILCLVAPAHAATSITSERESGTYESLILTGMDPARIVRGKFLASYAVFSLVVVAFAPIVGIAFLFGGVSPLEVLFGFLGLLLVLAAAIALGLGLSARLTTTRISILLALVLFGPASFTGTMFMFAFGEASKQNWGTSMTGPFWFTEALATRFFELDTFLLVAALPVFLFTMFVWFMLASAIAGVRPAAEDRSTPFKLWALVAVLGQTVIAGGLMLTTDFSDGGEIGAAINVFLAMTVFFYALVFMNEPPLAPRVWELRQAARGPIGRVWRVFGPGAAPTMRAAALILVAASLLGALATSVGHHLAHPGHAEAEQIDLGYALLGVGTAVVGLFALSFGTWLRVSLRSGVAARVLTVAVFFAAIILPLLAVVITSTRGFSGNHLPEFMLATPIAHLMVGFSYVESKGEPLASALVPIALYGAGALAFWLMVEARVRKIAVQVAAERARQNERAEEAASARASFPPEASPEAVAAALLEVGADPAAVAELAGEVALRRASEPPAPPDDVE